MKKIAILFAAALMMGLTACNKDTMYVDGDYSAEEAGYHYGWKYFMNVSISGDEITSVQFDGMNEEDNTKLKSETTAEEYPMDPHPSVWLPELEAQYEAVDLENYEAVDGITGATSASTAAQTLFELILDAALEGDETLQIAPAAE